MAVQMSIYPADQNPIYGDEVTNLQLDDEAGGGFFVLSQSRPLGHMEIRVTLEEIAVIYNLASKMIQDYDAKTDKI